MTSEDGVSSVSKRMWNVNFFFGDANMSYYNHVPERVIQAASMIRKHKNNDGNHNDNKN